MNKATMDEFSLKHRSIHSQFRNDLGRGMFAKLSQSVASNKSPNDQIIIFEINQISYCISGFHRKSLQKDKKNIRKTKQDGPCHFYVELIHLSYEFM